VEAKAFRWCSPHGHLRTFFLLSVVIGALDLCHLHELSPWLLMKGLVIVLIELQCTILRISFTCLSTKLLIYPLLTLLIYFDTDLGLYPILPDKLEVD
jgi:hypothetical protein